MPEQDLGGGSTLTYNALPPAGMKTAWAVDRCRCRPSAGNAAWVDGPPQHVGHSSSACSSHTRVRWQQKHTVSPGASHTGQLLRGR